jgi:hypothetical protein
MKLELTDAEHELTLHVLQNRLGELRQEIHHCTVSKFTEQLKETEVLLKSVIGKLNPSGVNKT